MNQDILRFKKFCESLNYSIPNSMQNSSLTLMEFESNNDKLLVNIDFADEISIDEFYTFYKAIKSSNQYKVIAKFNFDFLQYKHTKLVEFIDFLIQKKQKFFKLRRINWANELKVVRDYEYEIYFVDDANYLEMQNLVSSLELDLIKYGFSKLKLTVKPKQNNNIFDEIEDASAKKTQDMFLQMLQQEKKSLQNNFAESGANTFRKKWSQKQYEQHEIEEILSLPEKTNVEFCGQVFDFDISETKNGKFIYSFALTNNVEAIKCKMIRSNKLDDDETKIISVGQFVKIKGSITIPNMGKPEPTIFVDSFEKSITMYEIELDDLSQLDKRVELHVSSKFSTMDGLINPGDIIDRAEKLGMSAVAISDLDAVQGYPHFYAKAKKSKVKAIYGASFSAFRKKPVLFLGSLPEGKISDTSYVSFDIETTGLSPRFHELIEYGSYSIPADNSQPQIVQFLIKPQSKLSPFTTKLTGISQRDVDTNGLNYKEALQKIYNDLNNKIALAHNAKFDYHFIKEQFRLHDLPFPNVTVIDTLVLSRLLFPERKKHSLGDLASNLGVSYNPNVAHRGDYDAAVLAQIWVELVHQMKLKNIETFSDLYNYEPDSKFKERFPYTISTLVKTQKGLKKQFNMVTECLTSNFNSRPRTFLEDIKPNDDLLFGSGTLCSKLIDDYFYSSWDEFINEVQRYDYIEIPAPQAFQHWIDSEFITREQLNYALKEIILTAKKYNKIPVATADVKYLDSVDKKAFEVLVYAKGIGAARHYLYNYDKAKEHSLSVPNLNFLNTTQMLNQFSFLGDTELTEEIVITNSNKIADMCDRVVAFKDGLYTPKFDNSPVKLKELVYANARKKYGEVLPELIEKRIEAELTPIIKYGFDVIYWISHKLVKKSLDDGYIVGSRGSVGSSLVATLCEISEVNPLDPYYLCNNCKKFELANVPGITSAYDLPDKVCTNCNIKMDKDGHSIAFETFLGFNADKVPDIDLNFSGEFQGKIHNETRRLFGDTHTLRAGTISTVAFKTGLGYVRNFFEETGKSSSEAFISYLAKKIEGVKRTTGQHAGGVIVIPKEYDVSDFTPINYPADDVESTWFTTHFDFKAIHDNVLKLDLLGHDNPTVIKMLEKYTGIKVSSVPKNDHDVVAVFSSTKPLHIKPEDIGGEPTGAIGLPEFGTSFVRQMLDQAQPRSFADLVSISGLSHGTNVWLGNNQDLIMKQGFKLPDVFSCRDDILEKLVKQGVPNKFSFDIMEKVRKGKGLTADEEKELKKYNVPDWQIDSMQKIAYMFPKAHAVAYVLMAYWFAWYKIHYPLAFYASYYAAHAKAVDIESMVDIKNGRRAHNKLVTLQNTAKEELSTKDSDLMSTLEITRELYARGLYIANIDLSRSLAHEWLIDEENQCLIPPFKSLDGLGDSVAENIIAARNEKEFTSIQDLSLRGKVNKTLIEKLEKIGALSHLDETDQMRLF
ncbi:PolC-type DNA polymerase III [Mycoplasma simbae]|uniref:PolC-type DNA polymerase III n=1 Tax=Mycoplasma simbae TaxID=36744 RepID=UPI000496D2EF|nr:PolC-type DNA polymerase III [Mycoplasma simbae]